MKKRWLNIYFVILITLVIGFTGCLPEETSKKVQGKKVIYSKNIPEKISKNKSGIKIGVIRKIGGDDQTTQFLAGVKKEAEALGFTVDIFSANGDSVNFHNEIDKALYRGYDGVIISHGDDAESVEDVKKLTNKGIKVVTFDSNPEISKIEGVTCTFQDDEALAGLALYYLKKVTGGNANIEYLWVDGFQPMVIRNKVYDKFKIDNPGIKEVHRFGVSTADAIVQTQIAVDKALIKYPKGKLDVIFATWDSFAKAATSSVKDAGRNDVKIVSIDVSDADLKLMQEIGSPWVATAAVSSNVVAAVDVRILAKKIAEEQTPDTYKFSGNLITQSQLKDYGKTVTMKNLSEIIPGWGRSDAFDNQWIKELRELFKK